MMPEDAEDGSSSADTDTIYVAAKSLLSALAIVGNLVVVVAVVRSPLLRVQLTNFFVINLCVVDLVAAIVVMPMSLHVNVRSSAVPNTTTSSIDVTGRSAHCTAFRVLSTFVVFASVLSIALANVERYVSIRYPMQHAAHLTVGGTLIAIASVWAIALAVAATPVLAEWNVLDTGSQCCDEVGLASSTSTAAAAFVIVVLALLFVSPTLMMAAMCWSIYRVARQVSRQVAPGVEDGHGGNAESPPELLPRLSSSASCSVNCSTTNNIRRHDDKGKCERGSLDEGKVIQVHPATPSLPAARSAPECIIRISCHEDDASRNDHHNRRTGSQTPTRVVEAQLSAGVTADRRWKAVATLLFILLTFVPLWSPYFAYSLYHAVQRTQQAVDCDALASAEQDVEKAVVWIGFATFASNAFVYGWMNRAIRDALRDSVYAPCSHCKRRRARLSEVMGTGDAEDFFQFLERTSNFDRGQLSTASIELSAVNQTRP